MGDYLFALNLSFRPKSKLDPKIQLQTISHINFGFRLKFTTEFTAITLSAN